MGKNLKGKELGKGISQRKDKAYTARFTNKDGKRIEFRCKTVAEARAKLKQAIYDDENDISSGVSTEKSMTLDMFFDDWINIYKKYEIKPSTMYEYKNSYNGRIKKYLGEKEIDKITELDIRKYISLLENAGLKSSTIERLLALLKEILVSAVRYKIIAENPAKYVKIKKIDNISDKEDVRHKVLTEEEVKIFLEYCKGHHYENLFIVILNTGMRIGEISALRVSDIDFNKRTINVNKTLHYFGKDKGMLTTESTPKTRSSQRIIPMNETCYNALKNQLELKKDFPQSRIFKRNQDREKFEDIVFFTTGNTSPDRYINVAINIIVKKIRKETGMYFPKFSAHSLRHTFATRCFNAGIPPKVVQSLLGHSRLSMTMDIYTHVTEEKKNDEISKLDFF